MMNFPLGWCNGHASRARLAESNRSMPERGLFDDTKDCSICYDNCEPQVRLPCGHLMCSRCLQQSNLDHCALKCADGKFDRKVTLQSIGIEEPAPPPKPPRRAKGRPYIEADDLVGRCEPLPSQSICGLSTTEVCPHSNCPFRMGEESNDWGEGSHDIVASPNKTLCRCGRDRCLRELILTDCYAQLTLIEAFNNGKKKHIERNIDSCGKVTRFELLGHYNRLEVIASKAAIAAKAPQSRKQRPKALILSVEQDRPGSSEEQASAGAFFQQCGYDVIFERNPDCSSLIDAVRRFRMQQHAEACAVAIMAHGAGGAITSSDGQLIALNQLFGMLDSVNAPHLQAVQKYCFVQACRGLESPLSTDPAFDAIDHGGVQFTRSANFHWCYATTPGVPAFRGKMFEALNKVAREMPGERMDQICLRANALLMRESQLLMHIQHTLTLFPTRPV